MNDKDNSQTFLTSNHLLFNVFLSEELLLITVDMPLFLLFRNPKFVKIRPYGKNKGIYCIRQRKLNHSQQEQKVHFIDQILLNSDISIFTAFKLFVRLDFQKKALYYYTF